MARIFGVRLVVILGFAFTVVLVQIIAVSRLGSYSQEFIKEEEQKLLMLNRKPTTSLGHVSVNCECHNYYISILAGETQTGNWCYSERLG